MSILDEKIIYVSESNFKTDWRPKGVILNMALHDVHDQKS